MEDIKNAIWVHYGHMEYNPLLFQPIRNCFTKPEGGLWASAADAEFGWKDWCEREKFRECKDENSFKFRISPTANILSITSVEDLKGVPRNKGIQVLLHEETDDPYSTVLLDFEELTRMGIDAVYVDISSGPMLHWKLYGWDCDSIVVMNPDVIIQEK